MHKDKLGLFIVMFSLLFIIIKLHKKHFEQFRFLNCDLSKSDTQLSDADFTCCEAKKFLIDKDEGHPLYSHYKNISDQCKQISTIDISKDNYFTSDHNTYYDSLDIRYNDLVAESNATKLSYDRASATLDILQAEFASESNIYNAMFTEFSHSNARHDELIQINSNLNEMSNMHEYKLALQTLDDVINKDTINNMGIHTGLKLREVDIQNQMEQSLNKSLDYISGLSDLYVHNVKLYESIEKTKSLANETHSPTETTNLKTNIESSSLLYKNSLELLNKSETALFKIHTSIKELASYIYQTNESDTNRKIVVNDAPNNIEIIFEDGMYKLPPSVFVDGLPYAEFINANLFKKCSLDPNTQIAVCTNFSSSPDDPNSPPIEGDVSDVYKKQKLNEDNPVSSSFFATFLRYINREHIINNTTTNVTNGIDRTFKYAFLIKTFPPIDVE